jgi:membrane protein implicated in regulation of membrane protease activity
MLIYVAIGAFGFLFLMILLVMGDAAGGDHDTGGHDAAGGHGDADHSGPGIFSARIMASFLTAFGVGGIIGRYYQLSHPVSAGIGVAAGIVMSGVVYQFARVLYSQQASSTVRIANLVGRSAEVSVGIPANGVGQIALMAGGERVEQVARSADGAAIARGTEVIVTALRGDSLVVAPTASPAPGGRP